MAEHDASPPTSNLKFPEWQRQYQAALMELDRKKLPERVLEAENAIFQRLQSLAVSRNGMAERQAIEDALGSLRVLKREQLDFPDWE